jgi:hypothetical protein
MIVLRVLFATNTAPRGGTAVSNTVPQSPAARTLAQARFFNPALNLDRGTEHKQVSFEERLETIDKFRRAQPSGVLCNGKTRYSWVVEKGFEEGFIGENWVISKHPRKDS